MKNTVRDWMITPVVVVPPEVSVDQALRLMRDCGIRNLVVDLSANGGGYGIVTATDASDQALTQDRNPSEMSAAEIMTAPIECAEVDWTLSQASQLMKKRDVHYLPVSDERSALVGVISSTVISLAGEGSDLSQVH